MRSRFIFLPIILLSFFTFLFQCSYENPKAPRWDTVFNVPLMDHLYTIKEVIDEDENITFDQNGLLGFIIEQDIDSTKVGENLTLSDFTEDFELGLNDLQIPKLPVDVERYPFAQLTAQAAAKNGQMDTISAFSFTNLEGTQFSSPDFRYASVAQGVAHMQLRNNLPVDLQNLSLQLKNLLNGSTILITPLTSLIRAHDSLDVDIDLSGKNIPNRSIWLLSGDSPGSRHQKVWVDQTATVDLITELKDVFVGNVEARLPSIKIKREQQLVIDSGIDIAIDEIGFTRGRIKIDVDNKTPFGSEDIIIRFEQLKQFDTMEPLRYAMSLYPNQKSHNEIDLSGFYANLDLPGGNEDQLFDISITGSTFELKTDFVTLTEESSIEMVVTFEDVVIDFLAGKLGEQSVKFDSIITDVEISDKIGNLEGIQVSDARLQVNISNTIQLPIRFEAQMFAINDRGEVSVFRIDERLQPSPDGHEALTTLPLYTPQNSNILDFVNIQPSRIITQGRAWVGDGITYGRVSSDDYVRTHITLEIPGKLQWEDRVIEADTTRIIILPKGEEADDEDDTVELSGDVTNKLHKATVSANVENHMPVGLEVRFFIASDSTRLNDDADVILGPVGIEPAPTDGGGRVTGSKNQEVKLEVTEQDLDIFRNDGAEQKILYLTPNITIHGTKGRDVAVYENDYARVQALMQMEVRVVEE